MAAPMKCVKYLWSFRTNSERLLLIPRDFFCRGCVNLNTNVNFAQNNVCHLQIRKHFTQQNRLNSCKHLVVHEKCDLFEGQLKSLEGHLLKITTALSHDQNRSYSSQKNDNKDEPQKPKENIYTVPNLLTVSRIVLTPVIGYLVIHDSFSIALGLFAYAGITDLLDGYIARNFKNQMSSLGTALDPLADKLMITVLTVTLTLANLIPMPLAVVIIGRDILLMISGFVIRYVSLPPPKTLKRYFDLSFPTAEVMPTRLSKWNTANQILLVFLTLAAPVFGFVDHPVLKGIWYLTGATTVGSGVDYIINYKKCIKFIK